MSTGIVFVSANALNLFAGVVIVSAGVVIVSVCAVITGLWLCLQVL